MINHEARLFWLASYPKSGNTWTRSFIAALRSMNEELIHENASEESFDIDLNDLRTGVIASGREWIENALGFSLDSLTPNEIDTLRPSAYRYINSVTKNWGYHKAHDAYSFVGEGAARQPMFPRDVTRGALYIVRNPLDVCISFANHSKCSIDESIAKMNNSNCALCKTEIGQANQVRQRLRSWSGHVRSWQNADLPVKIVRYEDMKSKPFETFFEIATFLELPNDKELIEKSLELTRFERLQKKEREFGFREKPVGVQSFFRKGIVGDWKNTLSTQQVDTIVKDHSEVMSNLGYLP